MRVFPCWVVLQRLTKPTRRCAVGAAARQFLGQVQQQPRVQLDQVLATFCAPVLVAIFREEIAAVGVDRILVGADLSLTEGALRQLLEVVEIDPDVLGVERDDGLGQAQIGGALARQELWFERMASGMKRLSERVEGRLGISPRPEDLQDLLSMKPVARSC